MDFLENIIDFIRDHSVSPGVSLALIVLVGIHILEERLKGFRRFLNLEWFRTGKEDFPVSKLAEVLKDQVGLFVALTVLALLGMLNATFIFIAVGFVTADIIQHVVFSLVRRQYTPGVATCVLYLLYAGYFDFAVLPELPFGTAWVLGFMILGASFLILNYLIASRRARRWRERQSHEPVTT